MGKSKKRTYIKSNREKVGPRKAKRWLETQEANRKLSRRRIEFYADQMRMNQWSFNGQTITFDEEGHLIDGQHRLQAIIESGQSIETIVVRGVTDDNAQATIDCGMGRTAAHIMQIRGEANSTALAALLKYIWRYENRSSQNIARNRAGNVDIMSVLERHPKARDAVRLPAGKYLREIGGCLAQAAFCKYVLMRALDDEELADAFIEEVATGVNLETDSPSLALRRSILRLNRGLGHNGSGFRDYVLALFVKAMNAWANEQPMKQIRYATSEAFPRVFDESMFRVRKPAADLASAK